MEKLLKLAEMLNKAFPDTSAEVGVRYSTVDNVVVKTYQIYVINVFHMSQIKTIGMLTAVVNQLISEKNGN